MEPIQRSWLAHLDPSDRVVNRELKNYHNVAGNQQRGYAAPGFAANADTSIKDLLCDLDEFKYLLYAGTLRIVYVEVDVVDAISGEPLLIVVGLICSDECFDLVFIEDRNNVFRRMVDIASLVH